MVDVLCWINKHILINPMAQLEIYLKNILFYLKNMYKLLRARISGPKSRQEKWALSARVREIKRPKLTDSYRKYFGSIPAFPLVPVDLCRKWSTFHSEYTICEVCGLVMSNVTLVRTMKAISRFYFFILYQEIYEINKSLHVTLHFICVLHNECISGSIICSVCNV